MLYLVIHGSNWKLHLSALKRMALLFIVFDQDTYMEEIIIPMHLANIKEYPLIMHLANIKEYPLIMY